MTKRTLVPLALFSVLALITVLPARASNATNGWLVPYLAVGGNEKSWHFVTLLLVRNSGQQPTSGMIEVFSDNVEPLPVASNDGSDQRISYGLNLQPGETAHFAFTRQSDDFETGWIHVDASDNRDLDLAVILLFYDGDELTAKTTVQIVGNEDSGQTYQKATWQGVPSDNPPQFAPAVDLPKNRMTLRSGLL